MHELERHLSGEQSNHRAELEKLQETHKHELLKLRASFAITTQSLQTKTTTLQKSLR